jgi:hypothetical protein
VKFCQNVKNQKIKKNILSWFSIYIYIPEPSMYGANTTSLHSCEWFRVYGYIGKIEKKKPWL